MVTGWICLFYGEHVEVSCGQARGGETLSRLPQAPEPRRTWRQLVAPLLPFVIVILIVLFVLVPAMINSPRH